MNDLWTPEQAVEPGYVCRLCGLRFPKKQREQWLRHAVACGKRFNSEVVEAFTHYHNTSAFTGIHDKEQFKFVREKAFRRGDIKPGE